MCSDEIPPDFSDCNKFKFLHNGKEIQPPKNGASVFINCNTDEIEIELLQSAMDICSYVGEYERAAMYQKKMLEKISIDSLLK